MKKVFLTVIAGHLAFLLPLIGNSQDLKSNDHGIISAPLANVRENPVPKSSIITQVLMGDEVRILGKEDNRYRISILNQAKREGWVQQEAVLIPRDNVWDSLNARREWIVVAAAKTEALILDKTGDHKIPLYAGTRLPVLQKAGGSYKVQFPDRSVALIKESEATLEKPLDPLANDTKAGEIATTAKRFLNVQYFHGGLTAQGMDMRGLIYITYRVHGILLDTGRDALLARTTRVQKKDLAPGDILLLHGDGEGLYLGNGRFLHTVRKGAVRIAGIHDRRFSNSLQYGLRVIGAEPEEKKKPADMTADEILLAQARVARFPLGKRIAYWAGRFIGTPYDPDPLGLYVRANRIITDEKADCMYHVFRSVELASSCTPAEAVTRALELRFIANGILADGIVTNYGDRFQYGEDMVMSGKWGKNITTELGATKTIAGSRGLENVDVLPKQVLATRTLQKQLRDGDILYWVKDPKNRIAGEIVGHLSIVHITSGTVYVIHAAGDKDTKTKHGGGRVKEVPFGDYVRSMRFIGALVSRFE